jgi:hypothetical protein
MREVGGRSVVDGCCDKAERRTERKIAQRTESKSVDKSRVDESYSTLLASSLPEERWVRKTSTTRRDDREKQNKVN